MRYRPRFCCQCGERIERPEWTLLSSRRFCQFCETEVGHHDWTPRLILWLGLVLSFVGLMNYMGPPGAGRELVQRPPIEAPSVETGKTANFGSAAPAPVPSRESEVVENTRVATPLPVAKEAPTPPEKVALCGARTKKGRPCSRRVKGGGRCWQHEGKPLFSADTY